MHTTSQHAPRHCSNMCAQPIRNIVKDDDSTVGIVPTRYTMLPWTEPPQGRIPNL